MKYRNILVCSLILLALVSCDRTRSSTGWDYMPDMYYSHAYESYTPNPNFSDNMTMRVPLEGTIPRDICKSCHGTEGGGQGYLYTSQRYPYPPASLVNDKVEALKDGEIYHSITVGYGIMGAHGGMTTPDERWKIILHIRETLQK